MASNRRRGGGGRRRRGDPVLKLANPVLKGVDGNHTEDMLGWGAAEEDFNKANNLQGLSQSHGVGQNAPKAGRRIELFQRFNNVVIEKSDSTNLHEVHTKIINCNKYYLQCKKKCSIVLSNLLFF